MQWDVQNLKSLEAAISMSYTSTSRTLLFFTYQQRIKRQIEKPIEEINVFSTFSYVNSTWNYTIVLLVFAVSIFFEINVLQSKFFCFSEQLLLRRSCNIKTSDHISPFGIRLWIICGMIILEIIRRFTN